MGACLPAFYKLIKIGQAVKEAMTHLNTKQPDALRLADCLEGYATTPWTREVVAAELRHLQARNEQLEKSESDLIAERDYRDEIIDHMANAVLGTDRAEWSSSYNFMDAVKEIEDHIAELEAQLSATHPTQQGLDAAQTKKGKQQ